jgi:hypothetical protein
MRHLGLIIFLIIVMIITAFYPSRFAVVEYFENKKDASGNPIPKSTKTTTKVKHSEPIKPASKPATKPDQKDQEDSVDSKNIAYDETISQPDLSSLKSNYGNTPTLNSDKQSIKHNDKHTKPSKKVYSGISGIKSEKEEHNDAWIPKASLIPCSCPTTSCGHNLKQNSNDNDFGLLNEGTEEGTDIGPFSRPLIADVQLPNAALNKEWVRTNLMSYQPPKPFLSDFQTFTY